MEVKNLKEAARRIERAVNNKETIVLYGDADLDGVTAVLIAEHAIRSLGGEVAAFYFPDREKEGYGITKKALDELKEFAPGLLVAFDLGVGNIEEVPLAASLGFDVVIVDHHVPKEKLPAPALIVDPKQPGDEYPFKEFAACGLSYLLGLELAGAEEEQPMAELAALGTIADMMPREADNEEIIRRGTRTLLSSPRPALALMREMKEFSLSSDAARVEFMAQVLNAREVVGGLPGAFRALSAPTRREAKEVLTQLLGEAREKREQVERIVRDMRGRADPASPIVFEGTDEYDFYRLGSAASRLAEEFDKPVFLYRKGPEESLGSARAPRGKFDTVAAMRSCEELFVTYGGHPPASGFRVRNENVDRVKDCLTRYFS